MTVSFAQSALLRLVHRHISVGLLNNCWNRCMCVLERRTCPLSKELNRGHWGPPWVRQNIATDGHVSVVNLLCTTGIYCMHACLYSEFLVLAIVGGENEPCAQTQMYVWSTY